MFITWPAVCVGFRCFKFVIVLGGSNMTGTNLYVNKCKQSRSYLNHLILTIIAVVTVMDLQFLIMGYACD